MKAKTLRILTWLGKVAGLLTALDAVPFVDPQYGIFIFAGASLIKDTVNRVGDLLDDGLNNQSYDYEKFTFK